MTDKHDPVMAVSPAAQAAFDHDWTLAELLPAGERARLLDMLAPLVGAPLELVDGDAPPAEPGRHAVAVAVDIEALGWLLGPPEHAAALAGAAGLLRQILLARQRYHMASALHVQSVQADFDALREKHRALEKSEARYRELAAQLEARVAEQVGVIETRQRQLYQAERLAGIAQLAAGMAHEINNPIGFVRSNLNSARGYLRQLGEALQAAEGGDAQALKKIDAEFLLADFADLLKDSIDGVDRVAAIVRDLKGFSNVDRDEQAVIDLRASLDELCRLLASRLPRDAQLTRQGEAARQFPCRPGHLQQALFNILDNAIKAIGPGGRIVLRCSLEAGSQRIEVIDDGCGIAAADLPRVFDPFFTTRAVGAGIGLGLTLARDVILAQGGRIELHSQPGAGTRVDVRLPLETQG